MNDNSPLILIDPNKPSTKEVAGLIAQVITAVKQWQTTIRGELKASSDKNTQEVEKLKEDAQTFLEDCEARLATIAEKLNKDSSDEWYKALNREVYKLEQLIKDVPQFSPLQLEEKFGTVISDLEESLRVQIESIKPQTAIQVRDSLETLEYDERLDASAIKGLDKENAKLSDAIINRAIGIVDQRTSFLIQKVSNLQTQLSNTSTTGGGHTIQDEGVPLAQRTNLNFVGAGVTVTDDSGNNATKVTITSGGGSALNKETPSGAVDDSNVTFTVSNTPFFINVNGGIYEVGLGLYASYVAGTITLTSPIGTGGFIRSYY